MRCMFKFVFEPKMNRKEACVAVQSNHNEETNPGSEFNHAQAICT